MMTRAPHNSQPVIATAKEALRLLGAEDDRQTKLHEILETIREQIRLGVPPEHRPDGLFQNIQNAVYAMRGRTALLNDAAIVAPLAAAHDQCGVQNEQVQTLFTDLVGFIAGSRQHEIDLELRDQILNKVFAIRAALAASVAQADGVQAGEVDFEYTNWEGRKSLRRARPISIRFGKSEWHPKPQWLMLAFDIDKGSDREFAMADMEFEENALAALALSSADRGRG